MGSFEYMRPDVVVPRAIAAARKALELEPGLAEAHSSLAAASAFYTCDAENAFGGFERAIELNPEYASAWHFYGVVLLGQGLYDRALQALQRAQTLDPLSPIFSVQLASLHFLRREFGRAASLCDDLIRTDPDFWPARWFGGMALEQLGRTKEAVRYLELAIQNSQRSHWPLGALGHLFASAGAEGRALAIARELEQRREREHCSAAAIALTYVGLRQFDNALHWLHTARLERSPFCAMFLLGDPRLDCVRSDPRMQAIAQALGAAPRV
jgi:tetratricopeptide (TPR) repeat protein